MSAPLVLCPICLERFPWTEQDLYTRENGTYVPLARTSTTNLSKLAEQLRVAYRKCPNPARDTPDHYLPRAYTAYRKPIVVGLVAASRAGKSHLLASMIAEIEHGGLQQYGLDWEPLDYVAHATYRATVVDQLMAGRRLPPTNAGPVEFADALLITAPGGRWPVAFFDIAGEGFQFARTESRYVIGATALMFVVDPVAAGVTGTPDGRVVERKNDEAFGNVLTRLRALAPEGAGHLDLPAAVVVTKSDRLRLRYPVDMWLRSEPTGHLDPERIRSESRDVYAFLYQHRSAWPWLAPFDAFRRCTLHFASATGGDDRDDRYPRGARPLRVLEPLVALLAMSGVLDVPGAAEVGF